MKVLLCEDIAKLGWLGDVVEVPEGYARNYLLPQGIAQVATENNIKAIAQEKANRAQERVVERKRMEEVVTGVEGAEAVLAAKANEQGHLFGSITDKMIATNLREQGYQVADEIVKLSDPIKEVGVHTVTLAFAQDLKTQVTVTVVAEGQSAEEAQDGGTATEAQPAEEA
jgi:large subunit ribosomal protein L9